MGKHRRQFYPLEFYHVMVRGNNGKTIFHSSHERQYFLGLLYEALQQYAHELHAYCLMDNHVHLLIRTGIDSLEKPMHNVCMRYARWFNWHRDILGHLFQNRYLALHIHDEYYLRRAIRYIHLNPVRANMVTNPAEYPWSSHQVYLEEKESLLVETEFILGLFSQRKEHAIKEYNYYVNTEENYNDPNLHKIIFTKPDNQFDYIIDFCCKHYNILKQQIFESSPGRNIAKVRSIATYLAIKTQVCTISEAAKHFSTNISNLSRSLKRLKENHLNLLVAVEKAYYNQELTASNRVPD